MKVLLVEDEIELAKSIAQYLNENHIICEQANTLQIAFNKLSDFQYDCIILDLNLPDGDGFSLLKELKQQNNSDGIILVSAKSELETKIEGLQLGADDYLTKPFHLAELLVRIQALVRRKQFNGKVFLHFENLELNLSAKEVRVNNTLIDLTKTEYDLLLFLSGNSGKVLSKSTLAEHLSGDLADMFDNHDFVYAHVKNLKKKINEFDSIEYIKSVYGIGYKWLINVE